MKLGRILFTLCLSVALSFFLPVLADATVVESGTCGDNLTWILDDDGTLIISGTGEMENMSQHEDLPNNSTQPWGGVAASIKQVIIENGPTTIGTYAFYSCTNLTSVTIGNSVTTIDQNAFENCTGMTSITIPDSVTTIGDEAFSSCSGLTAITIGEGVSTIDSSAFQDCTALAKVYISNPSTWCNIYYADSYSNPMIYNATLYCVDDSGNKLTEIVLDSSVTTIPEYAFKNSSITSITIPDGVTAIGSYAFSGCFDLTAITIPESVTKIGSEAFNNCASLTSVIIPDGVTTIGMYAFQFCTGLTSVTISDSVTYIGRSAFGFCSGLTDVYISDPVAWCKIQFIDINSNPMANGDKLHILDKDGKKITEVVLDSSVTTIPAYAFANSSITSVTIPDSVTTIDTNAFKNCANLTDVYISDPSAWCKINFDGYYSNPMENYGVKLHVLDSNGREITEIELDASVTAIPEYAFRYAAITAITIPKSVISIGYYAFDKCVDLKTVYYAGTESQWNSIQIGNVNDSLMSANILSNHIHDYTVLPMVVVNATCTEDGYIEYTCVHSEKYRITIPALGHQTGDNPEIIAPTCTSQGYTVSTCTRCGQTGNSAFVGALGHSYNGEETVVPPTCTEQGYTGNTCTRCGNVEKESFTDALGHSMVLLPAIEPTCTETGLTVGTGCKRCDYVGLAQEEIAALGHSITQYESNQDATCTEDGTKTGKCDRCGAMDTKEDTGSAKGHSFVAGRCTVCGIPEHRAPGDLNGDAQVSTDDVVALLLHISMPDIFPMDADADFTGDGQVTTDDAVKLLLHISMPDVFPLEPRKKN